MNHRISDTGNGPQMNHRGTRRHPSYLVAVGATVPPETFQTGRCFYPQNSVDSLQKQPEHKFENEMTANERVFHARQGGTVNPHDQSNFSGSPCIMSSAANQQNVTGRSNDQQHFVNRSQAQSQAFSGTSSVIPRDVGKQIPRAVIAPMSRSHIENKSYSRDNYLDSTRSVNEIQRNLKGKPLAMEDGSSGKSEFSISTGNTGIHTLVPAIGKFAVSNTVADHQDFAYENKISLTNAKHSGYLQASAKHLPISYNGARIIAATSKVIESPEDNCSYITPQTVGTVLSYQNLNKKTSRVANSPLPVSHANYSLADNCTVRSTYYKDERSRIGAESDRSSASSASTACSSFSSQLDSGYGGDHDSSSLGNRSQSPQMQFHAGRSSPSYRETPHFDQNFLIRRQKQADIESAGKQSLQPSLLHPNTSKFRSFEQQSANGSALKSNSGHGSVIDHNSVAYDRNKVMGMKWNFGNKATPSDCAVGGKTTSYNQDSVDGEMLKHKAPTDTHVASEKMKYADMLKKQVQLYHARDKLGDVHENVFTSREAVNNVGPTADEWTERNSISSSCFNLRRPSPHLENDSMQMLGSTDLSKCGMHQMENDDTSERVASEKLAKLRRNMRSVGLKQSNIEIVNREYVEPGNLDPAGPIRWNTSSALNDNHLRLPFQGLPAENNEESKQTKAILIPAEATGEPRRNLPVPDMCSATDGSNMANTAEDIVSTWLIVKKERDAQNRMPILSSDGGTSNNTEPRKHAKKSVSFSDDVALISSGEDVPDNAVNYVEYVTSFLSKRSDDLTSFMATEDRNFHSESSGRGSLLCRSSSSDSRSNSKVSVSESDRDSDFCENEGSDGSENGSEETTTDESGRIRCSLCHRKWIDMSEVYCGDCKFYMSKFQQKT